MSEAVPTQAEFLEAFGITDPAPAAAEPPATEPPATEPPATEDPAATDPPADPADPADPAPTTDPEPAPTTPPQPDKSAQAFAQMRVENNTYKNTLKNVANILGIAEVSDPVAMAEAIQAKALEAQAKKDNVPLETLQRLSRLEQLEQELTYERLKSQAVTGFEQVAKTFQLSEAEVVGFGQQLAELGINPLEQPIDLVAAYRELHWETLLAKATEQGRQEEAARAAKAGQHSSEPGATVGGTPGAQDKVNTVKDLDNFFNSLNI